MKFVPPAPLIGELDGFSKTDVFGHAEFGDRLANIVCAAEDSLTIVLDGAWGSGKTTFIHQWAGVLRQRKVPVIHFDAFANDYLNDAFIAVTGEILAKAEEFDPGKASGTKLAEKAKEVGRVLLRHGVSALVRVGTFGALDGAALEELGEDAVKAASGKAGDAVGEMIAKQLEGRKSEREVMRAFRQELQDLAAAMKEATPEGKTPAPLVFIIDELDRCRPSFALDLLERLKHLFAVPGVVFVLVTNLDQLQHAVRGAYGEGTNGALYLEKFYDLRLVLPVAKRNGTTQAEKFVAHLWQSMGLRVGDSHDNHEVQAGLIALCEGHGLDLRGIERIITHVALAAAATGHRTLVLPPLIGPLCVMRRSHPDLYRKAQLGNLVYEDEVKDFLRPGRWRDESSAQWYAEWWRYFTDRSASDADPWFMEIARTVGRYGLHDRLEIVPWGCRLIDDLVVAEKA